MASLIESYEQQYSNLTAEITVNVGKIGKTLGGSFHTSFTFIMFYCQVLEFRHASNFAIRIVYW